MVRPEDRPDVAFGFVMAHHADYPTTTMCRVLGVSTSGYYAWRKRPPSKRAQENEKLTELIHDVHDWSRGTYGSPRIHAELRETHELGVSENRVARLMRKAGIRGVTRRRFVTTTKRAKNARPAPDLVDRDFSATSPNQLWVADITFVPTRAGFCYLAVIMDAFSRRVVGWAFDTSLETSLVLKPLRMAVRQRQPARVIHHSDQGCQYTSMAFGARCKEAGVHPSMGSVADCYDNAMCESFFATLECELLDRSAFSNQTEARRAIFEFIEGWYNPHRRHSALDYLSPINYERRYEKRLKSEVA